MVNCFSLAILPIQNTQFLRNEGKLFSVPACGVYQLSVLLILVQLATSFLLKKKKKKKGLSGLNKPICVIFVAAIMLLSACSHFIPNLVYGKFG